MDELTVNTIPESTESVTEDPARDPDDWSDIDFSDLEVLDGDEEESQGGETQNDTAEPEADQQEGEAEAEAANEPTAEAQEPQE